MGLVQIPQLIFKKFLKIQFFRFFLVGIVATLVDWILFYFLQSVIYYQFALLISVSSGAVAHYTLNKIFTFRCKSKQIAKQFSVFIGVFIVYLILSAAIMYLFVDIATFPKMESRITTTFIMLVINYLMQKSLTFNKKIFN